jgi:hypothetical protein
MFLGLPGFAWFVVAVLVTVVNWYIMYCVDTEEVPFEPKVVSE